MFSRRGEMLEGRVQKINAKYAAVLCAPSNGGGGEKWRVPYRLLQLRPGAKNHGDSEKAAAELARELMDKHGLADWRFALDDAESRAAVCRYRSKTIGVSRLFARAADTEELRDAILHEIAHALAGANHHHDGVWKTIARKIGCTANRCCEKPFAPAQWLRKCAKGCFPPIPARRRRRGLICIVCRTPIIHEPNPALSPSR